MIETRGGFLISQIKQIQGRIFGRLLTEAGVDAFNGAQGHILYVLWQEDNLPIVELSRRTGLAEKARKYEEKYTEVSDEMSRLFYKGFTDEEILRLDSDLERILNNLEQEEQKL